MTPDIVAARNAAADGDQGRMIVLDAKYRVADGLNDALTSIHTYRDALVQEADAGGVKGIVSAAYLLTLRCRPSEALTAPPLCPAGCFIRSIGPVFASEQ